MPGVGVVSFECGGLGGHTIRPVAGLVALFSSRLPPIRLHHPLFIFSGAVDMDLFDREATQTTGSRVGSFCLRRRSGTLTINKVALARPTVPTIASCRAGPTLKR